MRNRERPGRDSFPAGAFLRFGAFARRAGKTRAAIFISGGA